MGVVLALGYALGFIGLVWFAIDSSRIPAMIWYWSGYSRPGWWAAMFFCFIAMGFPAFIGAVAWRFGEARKVLRMEFNDVRQQGQAAREARLGKSPGSVA